VLWRKAWCVTHLLLLLLLLPWTMFILYTALSQLLKDSKNPSCV
jgi:hypothetical protein